MLFVECLFGTHHVIWVFIGNTTCSLSAYWEHTMLFECLLGTRHVIWVLIGNAPCYLSAYWERAMLFECLLGTRQGCMINPLLFRVYSLLYLYVRRLYVLLMTPSAEFDHSSMFSKYFAKDIVSCSIWQIDGIYNIWGPLRCNKQA